MPHAWPASYDTLVKPTASDRRDTVSLAGQLSDLDYLAEAFESAIGITSETSPTSLRYRANNVQRLASAVIAANDSPDKIKNMADIITAPITETVARNSRVLIKADVGGPKAPALPGNGAGAAST